MASKVISQVDPFQSTAKQLTVRDSYMARGSRLSVRMQRPSLFMVCIRAAFQSRLNANTAVKWIIHSSNESIS